VSGTPARADRESRVRLDADATLRFELDKIRAALNALRLAFPADGKDVTA
jgi:hypothetical protein